MKVILVNGSSRPAGCTARALKEVEKWLNAEGVETQNFFIGNQPIADCTACMSCRKTGKCVFNDKVNEFTALAREADGFVFGSPVYYAHPSGRLMSFMDRAFYSAGSAFMFKPAAAVFSARRAGSVTSMDVVNKHFSICSMPIISSTYWNHVFGKEPAEVEQDAEGLTTMKNIALNMAWILKCIECGKAAGILRPENEKVLTNFFRA